MNDFDTPVYCCVFLPSEASTNGTSIVCTGGGHKFCFLDCSTGKHVKMFQEAPSESFCCIAATYIPNFQITKTNKEEISNSCIVAAAGKQATIKLVNYQRNEFYNILQGHTGNINELSFSRKTPHHLLLSLAFIVSSNKYLLTKAHHQMNL